MIERRRTGEVTAQGLAGLTRLRAALRQNTGNAAVEFALLSLPFFFVLLMLFEGVWDFFLGQQLDGVALKAARQIRLGAVQAAGMSSDDFRTKVICPLLPSSLACGSVVANIVTVPLAWNPNRTTGVGSFIDGTKPALQPPEVDAAKTSFCPGGPGSYTYLDLVYPLPNITSVFAGSMTTLDGKLVRIARSTSMWKNEPYQGANGAQSSGC